MHGEQTTPPHFGMRFSALTRRLIFLASPADLSDSSAYDARPCRTGTTFSRPRTSLFSLRPHRRAADA